MFGRYIKKLVDGEFSLAKTFWVFWVLPSLFLNCMLTIKDYTNLLSIDIILLLGGFYQMMMLCALWNSATNSKSKFWKTIVKSIVVFNVILLLTYSQ